MAEANLPSDMAALSLGRCVQAALDCDLCEDTTDINWRCLTCPANICAKCKAVHESRLTFRQHKITRRLHHRPLSPSNVTHLKDIHLAYNRIVEIHHSRSNAMIEYYADSKYYISIVKEDGKVENPKKFDFQTHGFVISPCGTIFVCDIHDKLIWKVKSPSGALEPVVDTSPEQPWGVCINSDGNIVVCLKISIAVFAKDGGQILQKIKKSDTRGKEIFRWAYKIFQDQNKHYRLLDWEGHSVLGFDELFNLQWNYISKQRKSVDPLAICGDSFQNVLVGFYSGTVEVLNSTGNFLMLFEISKPTCPQQISVDKNNVLWVVKEYERKISLFQYM